MWTLVGFDSFWVLFSILVLAYAIGSIVRFDILHIEPLLGAKEGGKSFRFLNTLSYFTLGISYLISIAFYIRILSAFVLKGFSIEDEFMSNVLTTVILGSIGAIGYFYGFRWLEKLTEISVNIKICVILVFLLALFYFDWVVLDFHPMSPPKTIHYSWETIRKIFGILLIVQGFEISRYMGKQYSTEMRIKTMKSAQIISALIYLSFIFLVTYLMGENQAISETEIINLGGKVSAFLPIAITIGAVFSQFSAAVADTIGTGGIVTEYTKNKISLNHAYLMVTVFAIILIWSANIYEIISYASRSFAAYYLTQCMQAVYANQIFQIKSVYWSFYFAFIGIALAILMIFGLPAEV